MNSIKDQIVFATRGVAWHRVRTQLDAYAHNQIWKGIPGWETQFLLEQIKGQLHGGV